MGTALANRDLLLLVFEAVLESLAVSAFAVVFTPPVIATTAEDGGIADIVVVVALGLAIRRRCGYLLWNACTQTTNRLFDSARRCPR